MSIELRSFLRAATAALAATPWLASASQSPSKQVTLEHDMSAIPVHGPARSRAACSSIPA